MKILSMSGFIPEYITDIVRFDGYVGNRSISHFCGYASDFISYINDGNKFDGVVFPKTCDSTRIMSSYVDDKKIFIHQINMPLNNGVDSLNYLAHEIERYKICLEKYFNITITDISDRIIKINERNANLLSLYNNLDKISYFDYLNQIHRLLRIPLNEQQVSSNLSNVCCAKKGYIVGSFLCNTQIVDIIEKNGIKIVGDNLPESGRLVMTPSVKDGDVYYEIAKSILNSRKSPSLSNFKNIIERDLEEIKNKNVQCVIFIIQKYCEAYEYFYSVYKKYLDELNIPSIKIQLTDSTDLNKVELLVEAFAESI